MGQYDRVGDDKVTGIGMSRRTLGKSLPRSSEIPTMTIKSDGLEEHIQYMKDHALIAKFVGIWPIEKDLICWINHHWKPRGDYELRLGAKKFFIIIFYNLEDKNKIFEGGSYLYNLTGLYLTFWQKRFSCTNMVEALFPPLQVLQVRDPIRYRKYVGSVHRSRRSNKIDEVCLLRPDLRLPRYLKRATDQYQTF